MKSFGNVALRQPNPRYSTQHNFVLQRQGYPCNFICIMNEFESCTINEFRFKVPANPSLKLLSYIGSSVGTTCCTVLIFLGTTLTSISSAGKSIK